jgi:hypothetical protein
MIWMLNTYYLHKKVGAKYKGPVIVVVRHSPWCGASRYQPPWWQLFSMVATSTQHFNNIMRRLHQDVIADYDYDPRPKIAI